MWKSLCTNAWYITSTDDKVDEKELQAAIAHAEHNVRIHFTDLNNLAFKHCLVVDTRLPLLNHERKVANVLGVDVAVRLLLLQ